MALAGLSGKRRLSGLERRATAEARAGLSQNGHGYADVPVPATIGWEMLEGQSWNALAAVPISSAGMHYCSVVPKFNNTRGHPQW